MFKVLHLVLSVLPLIRCSRRLESLAVLTESRSARSIRHNRRTPVGAEPSAAFHRQPRRWHVAMENRLYPMRELLGDLLLEAGRPAEAFTEYMTAVRHIPEPLPRSIRSGAGR